MSGDKAMTNWHSETRCTWLETTLYLRSNYSVVGGQLRCILNLTTWLLGSEG